MICPLLTNVDHRHWTHRTAPDHNFVEVTYNRVIKKKESMNDIKMLTAAGYSGTPLVKKLGIKEGFSIRGLGTPENYLEMLDPLPAGVKIKNAEINASTSEKYSAFDLVHIFTNSRDELFRTLAECVRLIKQNGTIWVSWYKKAAKLPTEITEDNVREAAFPLGLVDVKVCAVDEKWSGLKLVIRKENRI